MKVLVQLAFYAAVALAGHGPEKAMTRCYTEVGSTSPNYPCPTWHGHSYTPCTVTITKTTTKTTSAKSTVTSTVTTTKTSSIVSTFTAPANFKPVQDTLPSATYDGLFYQSKRKRDLLAPAVVVEQQLEARAKKNGPGLAKGYPTAVSCYTYTHSTCSQSTWYETAFAALASKGAPTVTTTVTSTTTTVTSTYYPACQTNNFADIIKLKDGKDCYIANIETNETQYGFVETGNVYNSSYDCCVAAISDPKGSEIWAFELLDSAAFSGGTVNVCVYYLGAPTCAATPAQASATFTVSCTTSTKTSAGQTATSPLVVGNGYCGEYNTALTPTASPT